jgi:hypothetical protein
MTSMAMWTRLLHERHAFEGVFVLTTQVVTVLPQTPMLRLNLFYLHFLGAMMLMDI